MDSVPGKMSPAGLRRGGRGHHVRILDPGTRHEEEGAGASDESRLRRPDRVPISSTSRDDAEAVGTAPTLHGEIGVVSIRPITGGHHPGSRSGIRRKRGVIGMLRWVRTGVERCGAFAKIPDNPAASHRTALHDRGGPLLGPPSRMPFLCNWNLGHDSTIQTAFPREISRREIPRSEAGQDRPRHDRRGRRPPAKQIASHLLQI